jgi:hypothetical protein
VFGPHSTLTLEQIRPDGETHWRVTSPVALAAASPGEPPPAAAPAAPAPASGGSLLMTSTVTLAVWPDAYFTIAAMVLCGARLEIRVGDRAAAVEILERAADSAPAELPLPDGRRMRPRAEDLDRLRRLMPQTAPRGKASSWIVVWLDDPPWALAPAAAGERLDERRRRRRGVDGGRPGGQRRGRWRPAGEPLEHQTAAPEGGREAARTPGMLGTA